MRKLTKKDLKLLRIAINSAIENEESFIDAHTCQFCHGTKIFQGKPCCCRTGYVKGSIKMVRQTEKIIERWKKLSQGLI